MRSILRRMSIIVLLSVQAFAADAIELDDIRLPPGFEIEVFAEVPNPRSLALGDNGTVFVGTRNRGAIFAVVSQAGRDPELIELIDGLKMPNGIAFFDGDLYVAETSRVTKYSNIESTLHDPPKGDVLNITLPTESHHGWRYIGFGPDEKLYISVGSPCNVCERDGFGKILRMNSDGSGREVFAEGIRNSVGFTWHPETAELWFTDNGRDRLGDDIPPDELNRVTEAGQHFGFPYCHGGDLPDADFGRGKNCADYIPPARKLGPHVAALGVKFYTGTQFPEKYRGQIFVAEHGSWNRSKKIGYRISLIELEEGVPVSYQPFADGWLQGQSVSGRPVDLLQLADGSLLVSDDTAGKIYRIRYEESSN